MSTTLPTIALPPELLREIDEAVAELSWSRETVLRAAVQRLVASERQSHDLQQHGQERARAMGLETEDDIEEYLDSLSDAA
jgi:metal-responsive CopG/Arc/MetJ family transcriptional regulator